MFIYYFDANEQVTVAITQNNLAQAIEDINIYLHYAILVWSNSNQNRWRRFLNCGLGMRETIKSCYILFKK